MVKKYLKYFLLLPVILAFTVVSIKTNKNEQKDTDPPFIKYNSYWVDSVFNSLTLDQKIGQLFMVPSYPRHNNKTEVINLIKNYNVGGIIYFKGNAKEIAQLTNIFQSESQIPLMTAMDAEWGIGMRVDNVVVFPQQLMLGAIENNQLIYQMGEEIAKQSKAIGVNINFAPVVDINNNPMNPVIGVRSFGENKKNVAKKGYYYALGMQDNNVLSVAKHFPGHGDTDVDSHKDLPIIPVSKKRLDTLEMFPFKQLIKEGVGGVMMAHLYIPSLDDTKNLPSSLSNKIVNDILIKKTKFKGLVFTDALGMQGVAKFYGPGEAEVKALKAGVDVLLMSKNVPLAFNTIKNAVKKGELPISLIDKKVKKIIAAKYWMDLHKFQPIDLNSVRDKLNTNKRKLLNRRLVEQALTLIKNEDSIIPFKDIDKNKIACVSVDKRNKTVFQDYLLRYDDVDIYKISKNASANEFNKLKNKLRSYDYIIVGIHNTSKYSVKTYGITPQTINFVNSLANSKNIILDLFGPPYALKRFSSLSKIKTILVSYEDTDIAQELSAQLLFGGIKAKGKLPVTINNNFKEGDGLLTSQIRLKYSIPAELDINYEKLKEIDSLIYYAIGQKAFPGCQVMAIKDGTVFYQKNYGYHTYKMQKKVLWNNLYDIASITKVAATTTALMTLYDKGKFSTNALMSHYLPQLDTTNKGNLKVIDVLTHQARLKPWIPFYKRALNRDWTWNDDYLSNRYSHKYCIKITDNVYTTKEMQEIVYQIIYDSKLLSRRRYKYSDLGFYLFKLIVEKLTQQQLDQYVENNIYKKLGAYSLCYNPLDKGFLKSQITPTEYDYRFRKQLVNGYVHDYGASLLQGVGGHAGLFSSANDLAKLFQMYLSNGKYASEQYLSHQAIKKFTSRPFFRNRRALGFDATDGNGEGPACSLSSSLSFGHTGFTGCMVWADPKYDFIYIFLSNRVYPSIENKKINELHVREKVQSLFYQSFLYYSN